MMPALLPKKTSAGTAERPITLASSTRNSVELAVVNGLMLRCLGPHSLRAAAILAGFAFPSACNGARPQAKDATETNAILRESDGGLGGEGGRQPRGVVGTSSNGIEPDASSEASERAFEGDVSPPVPKGTKIAEITGDQGPASRVQRSRRWRNVKPTHACRRVDRLKHCNA